MSGEAGDLPVAGEFLVAMEAIEFQLERCADAILLQTLLRFAGELSSDELSGRDYDELVTRLVERLHASTADPEDGDEEEGSS